MPYSLKQFIILNQEPPNTLSSYLLNQRVRESWTHWIYTTKHVVPCLLFKYPQKWNGNHLWQSHGYFQQQISRFLIPHFECVNTASFSWSIRVSSSAFCPHSRPQRTRWKGLNYQQHFGLHVYISASQKCECCVEVIQKYFSSVEFSLRTCKLY